MADVLRVRPRTDADRAGLLASLAAVHAATGYPPDGDGTPDALAAWLDARRDAAAWVGLLGARTAGHVAVAEPAAYLAPFIPVGGRPLEVTGLFVHPQAARRGIGHVLLAHAVDAAGDRGVLLATLPTWHAARALYAHAGLAVVGEFDGRHGRNLVLASTRFLPGN